MLKMANIPYPGQVFRDYHGIYIPDLNGRIGITQLFPTHAVMLTAKSHMTLRANILPNGLLTKFRLTPHKKYRFEGDFLFPDPKGDPVEITGKFPEFYIEDKRVWLSPGGMLTYFPVDFIETAIKKGQQQSRIRQLRQRPPIIINIYIRGYGGYDWEVRGGKRVKHRGHSGSDVRAEIDAWKTLTLNQRKNYKVIRSHERYEKDMILIRQMRRGQG